MNTLSVFNKEILIFVTDFKFFIPNCFHGKPEEIRCVHTSFYGSSALFCDMIIIILVGLVISGKGRQSCLPKILNLPSSRSPTLQSSEDGAEYLPISIGLHLNLHKVGPLLESGGPFSSIPFPFSINPLPLPLDSH